MRGRELIAIEAASRPMASVGDGFLALKIYKLPLSLDVPYSNK